MTKRRRRRRRKNGKRKEVRVWLEIYFCLLLLIENELIFFEKTQINIKRDLLISLKIDW